MVRRLLIFMWSIPIGHKKTSGVNRIREYIERHGWGVYGARGCAEDCVGRGRLRREGLEIPQMARGF